MASMRSSSSEKNGSHDNSQNGFTDPTVLEAYKLDGTFLWSINLGINIRGGAHYTQFQVYDLDGDGKAEIMVQDRRWHGRWHRQSDRQP